LKEALKRLVSSLYVSDKDPPEVGTAKREKVRQGAFKFCETLFKVFTWITYLVLIDLFRDRTGYGAFWILQAIAVASLSFLCFVTVLIPVIEAFEASSAPARSRKAIPWLLGISAAVIAAVILVDVGRVMANKIGYAQACFAARYEPNLKIPGCAQNDPPKHSPFWR